MYADDSILAFVIQTSSGHPCGSSTAYTGRRHTA